MINRFIVALLQLMPKSFIWIFSKRYIAGEDLSDAVQVTHQLNGQGIKATMDLLGELLTQVEKIDSYKQEYLRLIDESVKTGLDNSFSVKPTMFGLLLDPEICYQNIREIVSKAASNGRFVRIDMEDSQCTNMEIALYKRLLREFPGHVGLVFQAYLKRTRHDLVDLVNHNGGNNHLNIRICKGIYNEPEKIAFKRKEEINWNFLLDLDYMFKNNIYAAIATHDRFLIDGAFRMIEQYKVNKEKFEFQMLYGVTPELRKSIMEKGYTMRVYVPYGKEWFNYSMRRLKENPRMVSHIIKALFIPN
jgi:proline dehydrogenase